MYRMVEDFLRDHMAHFKLGSSLSTKQVTKGCPQGLVSGPTSWNIITGELISILSLEANTKIVVFADDITIMMQGHSFPDILNLMETTLQIIENWCTENRLMISEDKSVLMPMYTRNGEELKNHPSIIKWGIQIVSQLKYLGVTLECKMDWYPPYSVPGKRGTEHQKQPCQMLNSHLGSDIPQPVDDLQTRRIPSSRTPQRPGASRCPKEPKANCSKFREPASFL